MGRSSATIGSGREETLGFRDGKYAERVRLALIRVSSLTPSSVCSSKAPLDRDPVALAGEKLERRGP